MIIAYILQALFGLSLAAASLLLTSHADTATNPALVCFSAFWLMAGSLFFISTLPTGAKNNAKSI